MPDQNPKIPAKGPGRPKGARKTKDHLLIVASASNRFPMVSLPMDSVVESDLRKYANFAHERYGLSVDEALFRALNMAVRSLLSRDSVFQEALRDGKA